MGKKNDKISVRELDDAVKTYKTARPEASLCWNGIDIKITHTLAFEDMLAFVQNVIATCFSKDTGTYMPEVKPFIIRVCTIGYYTNISLPQNIEKKYDLVYQTDLYHSVICCINADQYNDILDAIDKSIDVITNANVAAANKQLADIQDGIKTLFSQFGEMFDGIDKEDIGRLMRALSDNKIDEEKLINAYMAGRKEKEE